MLKPGLENLYVEDCHLACCLLEERLEGWGFIAVSHFVRRGWPMSRSHRGSHALPVQLVSSHTSKSFTQVDNSSPADFPGRLTVQLVCSNIYMSVCVLLSLRLFTACLRRSSSWTSLLLTGWKAFLVSVEGQLSLAVMCWKEVLTQPASVYSFLPSCSGWLQLQGDKHLDVNTRVKSCTNCGFREAVGHSAVLHSPGALVSVVGSTWLYFCFLLLLCCFIS